MNSFQSSIKVNPMGREYTFLKLPVGYQSADLVSPLKR